MSDNPLEKCDKALAATPTDKAERQRFWIERGNRILWGQEPNRKGEYLKPRLDLHWVCRNDSYSIEPR